MPWRFSPTSHIPSGGGGRAFVDTYIVRTQTLYDRLLQLVDRVFRLLNEPQNSTHSVVVRNRRVARTQVPSRLGVIRKLLRRYQEHRHIIVHRESYKEDALRRIKGFYLADDLEARGDQNTGTRTEALRGIRARFLKQAVSDKRDEFKTFNTELFAAIRPLLDELESAYDQ